MENPIEKYNLLSESFGNNLKKIISNTTVNDCCSYEEKEYLLFVASEIIKGTIAKTNRLIQSYTFAPRLKWFLKDLISDNEEEQQLIVKLMSIIEELIQYQISTCPDSEKWYWKNLGLM